MSVREARFWIVKASLILTAGTFLFFLAAPALEFPLKFKESIALLKQITPVFVGYLGLAVGFLGAPKTATPSTTRALGGLLALLVRGPVLLYGFVMICALAVFAYSNQGSASGAEPMSYDLLATVTTTASALLTGTTSLVAGHVFRAH